jgi:hypothetical protein
MDPATPLDPTLIKLLALASRHQLSSCGMLGGSRYGKVALTFHHSTSSPAAFLFL